MSKREKVLLIILGAVFVLCGGYTAYAYRDKIFNKKTTPVATNNINVNVNANSNANTNSNSTTITPIVDAGVTWITPEKLANLALFDQKEDFGCDVATMEYYKVATLASGGEIIIDRASCGMGISYKILFKKSTDGKYYFLTKHNDLTGFISSTADNYLSGYGTKTFLDSETSYSSLLPSNTLVIDNGAALKIVSSTFNAGLFFSELKNATKIGLSNYGSIYRVPGEVDGAVIGRSLEVKLPDSTVVNYSPTTSFILDDNVANVTLDGKKNSDTYVKSLAMGCGGIPGHSILKPSDDLASRLASYGITAVGDTLFYVKSENDAIVDYVYTFYKVGRADGEIVSKTEFFATKPFFVWKDPFGDYMIFLNQKYTALAECGKPVIYLYPEKPTKVSVEVGAEITKSEPLYSKGWNVLASPSGKLVWNGKTFDSLYWEGLGNGPYPEVKSGFVVTKENVKSTLANHLTKLGLNDKERSDFLEFWLTKMPETPFVRLTWFGTREMDILAPLKVTPKPDTSIRIFLDYEGLNQKIDLKEQKLSSIPRNGFTLVEWGGLLRGNLK